MWFITHATSGESVCFLPEKLKYTVGRLGADVELHDDICVSRAHAAFHLVESDEIFKLELEDLGSKYGTFLNKNIETNTAMEKGRKVTLRNNDLVRFGRLQNIWKIQFMVIQTVPSALTREDNLRLRTYIESLGGNIIDQWSSDCTHLTMKDPSITMKLLYALVEQKQVVTINYWRDLLSASNSVKTQIPKPESYRPNFEGENIDFAGLPKRRSLFKGITFVFLHRKHYDMYTPIVKLAGGVSKDLNTGIQKTFLIKDKVVVVQYTPSTQTQSSETIGSIAEFLESNNKRIIPEYEIGLAILHCSMDKYCNPNFKASQTMSLASPDDSANNSAQIDLTDQQESISSVPTESMDLVISETNDNLVTSTPFVRPPNSTSPADKDEQQSMENICVTETAEDNPRKRKVTSIDLNDSEDQELFQFQSKKSCNKADGEGETSIEECKANNKTSNNNVFLQKTHNKSQLLGNKMEEHTSANKETRKRPLVQVLNDDDGNVDDLFKFGDAQTAKKIRKQNDEEAPEDDLFNFKDNKSSTNNKPIRTIEVDEDSNDMEPSQQIVVVNKKRPLQMPKPKSLPDKVSAVEWISSSLGKINIKKDNSAIFKEENGGENIKTESEIKSDPDAEVTLTEEHRKWLDSLKDAIEIQQISLKNSLNGADRSHYKFKNSSFNSAGSLNESAPNFKRFVKKYKTPLQDNFTGIKLCLR